MKHLLPIALLSVASTGLFADKVDLNGGILGGLSIPIGDLNSKRNCGTNSYLGAHIGGHLDINLTRNHQIRPHLTLSYFPGSDWSFPLGGYVKNKYTMAQLGADWVYNFDHYDRGLYTVAGLAFSQIKREVDSNMSPYSYSCTQSGKLALRGGLGYSFSKLFSLEGTVNNASVDKYGSDPFGFDSATWIQASAVLRFGK